MLVAHGKQRADEIVAGLFLPPLQQTEKVCARRERAGIGFFQFRAKRDRLQRAAGRGSCRNCARSSPARRPPPMTITGVSARDRRSHPCGRAAPRHHQLLHERFDARTHFLDAPRRERGHDEWRMRVWSGGSRTSWSGRAIGSPADPSPRGAARIRNLPSKSWTRRSRATASMSR